MKSFNLILALLVSLALTSNAFAAATIGKPGVPLPADVAVRLNNSATAGPSVKLGSQITYKKLNVMKAVYDFAVLGGASGTTYVLKDSAGGEATLPAGAIILQGITDEVTNVTVTGGSISFGINTAVDLLAATAGATFAGRQDMIPVNTAATAVKVTTASSGVTATITGGPVTAGKINVFLMYLLSD